MGSVYDASSLTETDEIGKGIIECLLSSRKSTGWECGNSPVDRTPLRVWPVGGSTYTHPYSAVPTPLPAIWVREEEFS